MRSSVDRPKVAAAPAIAILATPNSEEIVIQDDISDISSMEQQMTSDDEEEITVHTEYRRLFPDTQGTLKELYKGISAVHEHMINNTTPSQSTKKDFQVETTVMDRIATTKTITRNS